MKKILLCFLPILFIQCMKKEASNIEELAVIPFNIEVSDTLKEKNYIAVFDEGTNSKAELTQTELRIVNEQLIKAVDEYNNKIVKEAKKYTEKDKSYASDIEDRKLNLRNYFRQYFISVNSEGEKTIRAFCFCEHSGETWRDEKYIVSDGGDCFFNVNINLSKQNHDELKIHGMT